MSRHNLSRPPALVLDAHTNQALACVRSLGSAGRPVLAASSRRAALGAWSRWAVGSLRLRADTIEEYRQLRAWARSFGADMVLPMTERSCVLCNEERRAWEAEGMIVGCAPADALLGAFDKAQTLAAAARVGVRVPRTLVLSGEEGVATEVEGLGYPCVVKSRFSDAWLGHRFIRGGGATYAAGPRDLAAAVRAHRQGPYWPIVQRFVSGQGIGVSGLCDRGRPIALFAHERLRDVRPSGSGSSLRRSIALDSRLREPVERLLQEMAWHGPVMVEFRDDGGTPCLMEVNGRFWGSVQLAVSCGVDVPALWVAMLEGMQPSRVTDYREGVSLRWLWGDFKRILNIRQGAPPGYPGSYPTLLQGLSEILGPQPPGTTIETWDRNDPLPAVAEWVQGAGELASYVARLLQGDSSRSQTWPAVKSDLANSQ